MISTASSPGAGTVQPANALWISGARVQMAAIVAAATIVKLAICPFVGLGTNEAYAIASGRLMSLSYFDHPPLHFWLAHLCETIFGDNGAARIPFILLSAGTSWIMFALTRRLFGDRAAFWATVALNLSVFFNLISGNWILPDGPLNFFLLATACLLSPTAQGRSLTTKGWAAAGFLAGLAALSKYHALLFLLGYLLFLLTGRNRRHLLRTAGPWFAAAIALAVFSPVLVWNASNGWVSLDFQGGRAIPHHLDIGLFLSLLAAQIAVLLPGAVIPLVGGTAKALWSRESDEQFLLWLGLPAVLLFTLIPLVADNGMMQWAMPGWLLLMPLAGKFLDEVSHAASWPKSFMAAAAIFLFAFTIAAASEFNSGWLGSEFTHLFKHGDPTADNASWKALTPALSRADGTGGIVLTSTWRDAAKIDEALGGKDRVIVASTDPRNFAIALDPETYKDRDGWIILRAPILARHRKDVRHCFERSAPISTVTIARGKRADARLIVLRGNDFRPDLCRLVVFGN